MLIHTPVNLGYRCGGLHALSLTSQVWARYRYVTVLSGADIMLTPLAISAISQAAQQTETFTVDLFNRYGKRLAFSVDRVVFRAANLRDRSVWGDATAFCLAGRNRNPEAVLEWILRKFNFSFRVIGKRFTSGEKLHELTKATGVWHAHNTSAVSEYLQTRREF